MDDYVKNASLFDIYGSLLTTNEQEVFRDYYFDDLSLQEIANNKNVSKSAIHKTINTTIEKLNFYEDKLKILSIRGRIKDILASASDERLKNEILTAIFDK